MLLCVGVMTFEFYRMSLGGWNRTGQLLDFDVWAFVLTGFAAAGYGAGAARILFFMLPLPLITVWITVLYDKSDDLLKHAAFYFFRCYISLCLSRSLISWSFTRKGVFRAYGCWLFYYALGI